MRKMRQKGWESEQIKTLSALRSKTTTSYWGAKCSFLNKVWERHRVLYCRCWQHTMLQLFSIFWDAWIITKTLSNTEVKAFLYSFTDTHKKNKAEEKLSSLQLLQKWCAKFLPVTESNNRRKGCHGILLPILFFPL